MPWRDYGPGRREGSAFQRPNGPLRSSQLNTPPGFDHADYRQLRSKGLSLSQPEPENGGMMNQIDDFLTTREFNYGGWRGALVPDWRRTISERPWRRRLFRQGTSGSGISLPRTRATGLPILRPWACRADLTSDRNLILPLSALGHHTGETTHNIRATADGDGAKIAAFHATATSSHTAGSACRQPVSLLELETWDGRPGQDLGPIQMATETNICSETLCGARLRAFHTKVPSFGSDSEPRQRSARRRW